MEISDNNLSWENDKIASPLVLFKKENLMKLNNRVIIIMKNYW